MKIRKLCLKDAPFMLEWMHDEDVVKDLQANFMAKTMQDCENFIVAAQNIDTDLHMAIVDDNDEYMGTVSLKHISKGKAEFGITIRKKAMGKGYSKAAMHEIIEYGFKDLNIESIYWCVNAINRRAIRFYDKNGYIKININETKLFNTILEMGSYTEEQIKKYVWYEISK